METIEHLLWECKHAQTIWNSVTNFLTSEQIKVKFQLKDIILGIAGITVNLFVLNCIIKLAKYFIIKMKMTNQVPNCHMFINYFYKHLKIEQAVALSKDQLSQSNNKWANFL